MRFDVVIPTYRRESELAECLQSIYCQDMLPSRVIIVDDDSLSENFIVKERKRFYKKGVEVLHYKKDHKVEPRGSNESRNLGLKLAQENIVFIFDDDVVLREGFLSKILAVWSDHYEEEGLIGVSGIAENYRKKSFFEKGYNRLFGLTSKLSWDVNAVGFQVWDTSIEDVQKGHYMSGFCCAYKRATAAKLGFSIFKGGRGGLVDPDFCLRAKNYGYYFYVNPAATVLHKQTPISREDAFLTGFKEGSNRKIIFSNNCKKSPKANFLFWWANIGWILRQFLGGNFKKTFGMIGGLLHKNG